MGFRHRCCLCAYGCVGFACLYGLPIAMMNGVMLCGEVFLRYANLIVRLYNVVQMSAAQVPSVWAMESV